MVGKSVLLECLQSEYIESVLVINRHSIEMEHPKLREIIHKDFFKLDAIKDELTRYNACFFCLGTSSVGMKEEEYTNITYKLTKNFATTCLEVNPEMVFIYVSGAGTDSSEQGKSMWARVKGKTENMILDMGFKDAYAFRPGGILPGKNVKSKTGWINTLLILFKPFYPLLKKLNSVTTSAKLGQAMIYLAMFPQNVKHVESKKINELADWFNKRIR